MKEELLAVAECEFYHQFSLWIRQDPGYSKLARKIAADCAKRLVDVFQERDFQPVSVDFELGVSSTATMYVSKGLQLLMSGKGELKRPPGPAGFYVIEYTEDGYAKNYPVPQIQEPAEELNGMTLQEQLLVQQIRHARAVADLAEIRAAAAKDGDLAL